jgi:membrane protein
LNDADTLSKNAQSAAFYWHVLKESVSRFFEEDLLTHSAALSYYMIFSLPSMLLIVLWIAAGFSREVAVRDAIFAELGDLIGLEGAQQIMATLEKLNIQEPTWWATVMASLMLLFFATTVFDAMRTAFNRVSRVETNPSLVVSIWRLVRVRIIALTLLVSISFLLVVFLVLDAFFSRIDYQLLSWLGNSPLLVFALDVQVLHLATTTVLFALYFRYLPDARLAWCDTWFGAFLTASLFTIGKYLISVIIGQSEAATLYDAAGGILVLMLWVYYAAALLLFGATFTFTRGEMVHICDEQL